MIAVSFAFPCVSEAQRRAGGGQGSEKVSFVNDVAPIISAKCGSCHVSSSKGRYNIKSFAALMDSDSVVSKEPNDSYLIEVIENGEMPKGNLEVTDQELETLRSWIEQGAKFDGEDESKAISSRGSRSNTSRRSRGGQDRGGQARGSQARGGSTQNRNANRRPSRSRNQNAAPNAIQVNKLLALFDRDGDGKLSLKEIDSASRILRSFDTNQDDRIAGDELSEFGRE